MTSPQAPTPAPYRVPSWKKALFQAIPNVPLSTTTPLGGKVSIRARTHKGLVALQLLGYERHAKHEMLIFDYLKKHFNGSGVFFDIGANIGVFTVPMGLRCKERGGRVVSFEPDPDNVSLLRKNVLDNRINPCVEVVPKAVATSDGNMRFVRDTITSATGALATSNDNSLSHEWYGKKPETIEVSTTSVDDFVAKNKIIPSIIKIDVEGAEIMVLKGALKTLEWHAPTLILDGYGRDSYELLRSLGYKVIDLETNQEVDGDAKQLPFTVVAHK